MPLRRGFFLRGARQFFTNGAEPQSALVQNFRGKTFFFAQKSQKKMFGSDVFVRKPLRFFGCLGEHALAFIRKRKIDRRRYFFADGGVSLDLLADGLHRGVRAQKAVGQRFVFAQQSEQQMLGLDVRRAKLARFIPRKENYPSRLLCIALKNTAP